MWHYRNYIVEMINKMDEFDNSELENSDEEYDDDEEDFLDYYMSDLSSEEDEDYDDSFVISYSQMKEIMRRRPKYRKLLRKLLKGLSRKRRRGRNRKRKKKKGVRSRLIRKKRKKRKGKNRSRKIVISLKERKVDADDNGNAGLQSRVSNHVSNNNNKERIGGYEDEDLGVSVYSDYDEDNNSFDYYNY